VNFSAQQTGDTCTVNCRFNHIIVSLHLCKEYLTAVKLKTLFLLQIKYWMFGYMDYSALIKSNTLENFWNGRNMWTVNNGWVVILVKCGFIRLLQRIFNCDKMCDISITSDEILNSLLFGSFFASSYTRVTYCQKWSEFSWFKLIGIFGAVWFPQINAKNI